METYDHKNPISSGHDGHGGVHVCHKCGWPYPNPHPSSKIRRSHKKVCGTIDKYRLDNNAQEKTLLDGYDGELKSVDEFKTPSVERTISRRSSSGVGSRSSRSNRSEEDVFTDAGTEFNESPAIIAREASGGVIQRFYSMQNVNELDDSKPDDENLISGEDNSCTTDPLKDNQLQTVPSVQGEKEKMKADMASEDDISTNHSLVSPAAISEIDDAVDENLIQSSGPCSEMGIDSERGKEILSTKDEFEPRTSDTDTLEKTSLMEVDGLEDNESFNVLDSSERDDGEYFTVIDNDVNKVSEDDLAVRSSAFIKPTLDEVLLRDVEHFHTSKDMGEDKNIKVEGPILIGNEVSYGAAVENVGTEIGPATDATLKTDNQINATSKVEVNEGAGTSRKTSAAADCPNGNFAEGASSITVADILTEQHVTISTTVVKHINSSSRVEMDEDVEPSHQSLTAVNDGSIAEGAIETKQHVTIAAIDTNLDSRSITDSLDGNWGSVSVISTTSDATPTADSIALKHPRAIEGEENLSIVPKPMDENQCSENQVFVKSEVKIEQIESSSEIRSTKEQQHINSALTPTVADLANELNRTNKGKEIITEVTKWDSGNQNTPLKTLLGEATARSRAESPIHHNQSSTSTSTSIFMPKKDVIPVADDGLSVKKENEILNSDQPEMKSAQVEMGKEWNSPARYPEKIKMEKSRSKNRGYWVPFLCCSSVNAR